jgi:hypothetical protein
MTEQSAISTISKIEISLLREDCRSSGHTNGQFLPRKKKKKKKKKK